VNPQIPLEAVVSLSAEKEEKKKYYVPTETAKTKDPAARVKELIRDTKEVRKKTT